MSGGHFRNAVTCENIWETEISELTVHLTVAELRQRSTFASGGQFEPPSIGFDPPQAMNAPVKPTSVLHRENIRCV
jgi:hypothetical protein